MADQKISFNQKVGEQPLEKGIDRRPLLLPTTGECVNLFKDKVDSERGSSSWKIANRKLKGQEWG